MDFAQATLSGRPQNGKHHDRLCKNHENQRKIKASNQGINSNIKT